MTSALTMSPIHAHELNPRLHDLAAFSTRVRPVVRPSLIRRGRRECRVKASPMARLRKKMQAAGTTGAADHPAFPARWAFRLLRALPGDRLVCPRHPRNAGRHRRELDTSIGVPGPRDLTARNPPFVRALTRVATDCGHRLPASRLVTTANRPSSSRRDGRNVKVICPTVQAPMLRQTNTTGNWRMTELRGVPVGPHSFTGTSWPAALL